MMEHEMEQAAESGQAIPHTGGEACPCGSTKNFDECCMPLIKGTRPASTAEELMRSRYSAFTIKDIDHLVNSIHPDEYEAEDRARMQEWAESAEWSGLEILDTREGGPEDSTGEVEFIAHFRHENLPLKHHERAYFKKSDGAWYYIGGDNIKPQPVRRVAPKIGRNDPCTCGSGRKYKKCCGR